MNDDLHRFLDGDADPSELSRADRDEAEVWDRLTASLRGESPGSAPAWIETRVMAKVRAQQTERRGVFAWLLRPRTFRATPLTAGFVGALALALAVVPWALVPGPAAETGSEAGSVVYVQFTLDAPGARSVAVSGDFNQWAADAPMDDPDGDGVWTVRVPLQPGVHEYMFVVDGDQWVTDPLASRYTDDGFGNRNAVVAVGQPRQVS